MKPNWVYEIEKTLHQDYTHLTMLVSGNMVFFLAIRIYLDQSTDIVICRTLHSLPTMGNNVAK